MSTEADQAATSGATAVATPAATPVDSQTTPPTAPAHSAGGEPQTPDPGHAAGADFDHPVYGPKLKNFQKGLEDKAKALKALEEKHGTYEKQVNDLNARLATKPELLNQVRALYGLPPLPTAKQGDDDTEDTQPNAVKTESFQRQTDMAILQKQLELGEGNFVKGKALYDELHGPAYEVLKAVTEGDPATRLNFAIEYAMLKRKAAQTSTPAAPALVPGAVPATEMGRGTAAAPADEGPMTAEKALRLSGMTPAEYMSAQGMFD